jgi:hypothetical protein
VLPWNLRQLISYFFALINYPINLLKTARKTFATGNAIYSLPRTIIQITNNNSIFRKEGISASRKSDFINDVIISNYSTISISKQTLTLVPTCLYIYEYSRYISSKSTEESIVPEEK